MSTNCEHLLNLCLEQNNLIMNKETRKKIGQFLLQVLSALLAALTAGSAASCM